MPPWRLRSNTPPSKHSAAAQQAQLEELERDIRRQNPATGLPTPVRPSVQSTTSAPPSKRPPEYGRSTSHPFPSILRAGSKRRTRDFAAIESNFDDSDDSDEILTDKPNGKGPTENLVRKTAGDPEKNTGNCITCDSKLSWPRNVGVFRCTTCLTVNDLAPQDDQQGDLRQVRPLSLERTAAVINRCLDAYLQSRVEGRSKIRQSPYKASIQTAATNGKAQILTESPNKTLASTKLMPLRPDGQHAANPSETESPRSVNGALPNMKPLPGLPLRNPSGSVFGSEQGSTPVKPSRKPPPPPFHVPRTRESSKSSPSPKEASTRSPVSPNFEQSRSPRKPLEAEMAPESARHIFKLLEDYIVPCFLSRKCLNNSFSSSVTQRSPKPPLRTLSEGSTRSRPEIRREISDPFESTLDAKTLLLGEIGENGAWWSGKPPGILEPQHENHEDRKGIGVSLKSPHIIWAEVDRWYHTVCTAGADWAKKIEEIGRSMGANDNRYLQLVKDAREIEEDIIEARLHVQRTLLKATESLLKRPGSALKRPDDVRFLLILVVNPLLDPGSISSQHSTDDANQPASNHTKSKLPSSPTAQKTGLPRIGERESSKHAGILKRIFGLVANLSDECHRYLTSWFSRLDEERFEKTVHLVARFVTHRLARDEGRKPKPNHDPVNGLIPELNTAGPSSSAQLHAALTLGGSAKKFEDKAAWSAYSDDWQLRAAARFMSLLFSANNVYRGRKSDPFSVQSFARVPVTSNHATRQSTRAHGQLLPISEFYNTLLDYYDLIADFESWESRKARFSFCQYPFLLSIGSKTKILEHDARRQMDIRAREAFFNSLMTNKSAEQYLTLRVRRDCLVEDSLTGISEVVGAGQEDFKKGLRVHFKGEEGIDAGGVRKEWFLLLVREIFDHDHGKCKSYDLNDLY